MQTVVRNGGAEARARNGAARKGRGNQKRAGASSQKSTPTRRPKGSDVVGRDREGVKTALEHAVRGELDPALRAAGCRANSRLGGLLRDLAELSSVAPPPPKRTGGELSLDEIRLHNKNEISRFVGDMKLDRPERLRDRLFALVDAGVIETASAGELGTFIDRHVMRHENREAAQSLLPMFNRAFDAWEEDARPNRQRVGQAAACETQRETPQSDAARVPTTVPFADAVRATELLRGLDRLLDWDCRTNDVQDFGEIISQEGTPEERLEGLLRLAPVMQKVWDRIVGPEAKD